MRVILKPGGVMVVLAGIVTLTTLSLRVARPSNDVAMASSNVLTPVTAAAPASAFASGAIYDGTLENGWLDWSWCHRDLQSLERTEVAGQAAIRANAKFGEAVFLSHLPASSSPYDRVTLSLNGGPTGGQQFVLAAVKGHDVNGHNVVYEALQLQPLAPNRWTRIVVPLAWLRAADKPDLGGFWLQRFDHGNAGTFYVADVRLLTPGDAALGPESETTFIPNYESRVP